MDIAATFAGIQRDPNFEKPSPDGLLSSFVVPVVGCKAWQASEAFFGSIFQDNVFAQSADLPLASTLCSCHKMVQVLVLPLAAATAATATLGCGGTGTACCMCYCSCTVLPEY